MAVQDLFPDQAFVQLEAFAAVSRPDFDQPGIKDEEEQMCGPQELLLRRPQIDGFGCFSAFDSGLAVGEFVFEGLS